jgi:serine protease Do
VIGIDGHAVNSVSELQEWVARNRPGKEIQVTYIRSGQQSNVTAKLKNNEGNELVSRREIKSRLRGIDVEDIPYKELAALQLEGGVRIRSVESGKWQDAGIKKDFIISYIDKVPVDNVEDLHRILEFKKGGILIEGLYPNGNKGVYGIEW